MTSRSFENVQKLNGLAKSVVEYGARGDGATNDTAAISAALTAAINGGSVFVPSGVFLIDPITVTNAVGLNLSGPGTLKVRAGNVCHAILFSGGSDIVVDGLTIDGNNANTTDNSASGRGMLDFSASARVTVRNCYFLSSRGNSARYNNVSQITHTGSRHRDFSADAILLRQTCTDFLISENTLVSANANLPVGAHGINVEATSTTEARRGLIADNNIDVACAGIQLTANVYDTTVSGNSIKASPSNNGIKLDTTRTGIVVAGNTIYAGSNYGIFDDATDPAIISGNTIFAQVTYGIRSSVANVVISGNTVFGGSRGINTLQNGAQVHNNFVSGASSRGIVVGDDTLRSGANVTGNIVLGGQDGIYFRSTDGVCANNTVLNTTQYGISLINTTGSVFGPNTFRGNVLDGYRGNDFGGITGNTFVDAAPVFDNIATKTNVSVQTVTETAANIANVGNVINTTNKVAGRLVWDTTNNRLVRASGPAAADPWDVVDGSASVTPA